MGGRRAPRPSDFLPQALTCPANCAALSTAGAGRVFGCTGQHTEDSSICNAAVHEGVISNAAGGAVVVSFAYVSSAVSYSSCSANGVVTVALGSSNSHAFTVRAAAPLSVMSVVALSAGVQLVYVISAGSSGNKAYWMATTAAAATPSLAAIRAGTGAVSGCVGNAVWVDNTAKLVDVTCTLATGAAYKLWMALDTNGAGAGEQASVPASVDFVVAGKL